MSTVRRPGPQRPDHGFIKCQWSAHGSMTTICWRRMGMRDLIAAVDQNMNDVGRASTGRRWRGLAPQWCAMALAGAARPRLRSTGDDGSKGKSERGP
jgi:hypothetical protein